MLGELGTLRVVVDAVVARLPRPGIGAHEGVNAGLDRVALRVAPRRAVAYLRVPAGLSGLALLVYFPLIRGRGEQIFMSLSGVEPEGYLGRWLLATALFFGASAVLFVLTARKATP